MTNGTRVWEWRFCSVVRSVAREALFCATEPRHWLSGRSRRLTLLGQLLYAGDKLLDLLGAEVSDAGANAFDIVRAHLRPPVCRGESQSARASWGHCARHRPAVSER